MSKSRRQFLQQSFQSLVGLGLSPSLVSLVMQSISRSAYAGYDPLSNNEKIYIYFSLAGGPPRWFFDIPLTPNGTASNFTDDYQSSEWGTFLGVDSGKPKTIYKPWYDTVSKYWLPPVWGSNPNGGSFSNCLSNAAFIRGLNLEIDNHELGAYRNQSPVIGGESIAGSLSEKSNLPFVAAVGGDIGNVFRSMKGTSPIELNYSVSGSTNPISSVVKYFSGKARRSNAAITQASNEFDNYAAQNKFLIQRLKDSKAKADSLISEGVTVFTNQWPTKYNKYVAIVTNALDRTKNTSLIMENSTSIATPASDVRAQKDGDKGLIETGFDLRNMVDETTKVRNLAATFATIEIMVTMGLSNIFTTDLGQIEGLRYNAAGTRFSLGNDQHEVGTYVATLATTYLYRSILACTEELISVLKSVGIYNRTLIQFGSEFNRNPRANGSGSDHAPEGSSALLLSGMIQGTQVIGNCKKETNSGYVGSWGLSAPHPIGLNAYAIRLNDVVKTVCAMLGLKNITTNGEYVLENKSGLWTKFSDARGECKNV